MEKQNKIIIISLMLMVLIGIGLILAGAGDMINKFNSTSTMDKSLRDYLIEKSSVIKINPVINIECSDTQCKYSAVQIGIINSYDNTFEKGNMTTSEIENYVSDLVTQRLSDYANKSINEIPYTKVSEGTLTINQK